MADLEQANVRVPAEAKEAIARLARYLREDKGFLPRLKRFLDEEQDPAVGGLLSQRIDRLEEKLAAVAELVNLPQEEGRLPSFLLNDELERTEERGDWTTGEGKGRRLTETGLQEMQALMDKGWDDAKIAKRLGVSTFAITSKRKNQAQKSL
jgi:hypothetical protein